MIRRSNYLLMAIAGFALSTVAHAATWYVANNGLDGPACGSAANPCRSITQAIGNATNGDDIIVGPGLYGDVNDNTVLGDPGDEVPSPGCGCLLSINKDVTIVSSDGPAVTVIDPRRAPGVNTTVLIIAAAQFGKPTKGFTVMSGCKDALCNDASDGIVIDGSPVTVSGNQVISPANNFGGLYKTFIIGDGISTVDAPEVVRIDGNQVIGWASGIVTRGAGKTIVNNVVTHNLAGIDATNGHTNIAGNVGVDNHTGIFSNAADIVQNGVYGNVFSGLAFDTSFTGTIVGNSISGNKCGLRTGVPNLPAAQNYWGAATGPGPDPADDICGPGAGTSTTTPFSPRRAKVKPRIVVAR